MDCDGSWGSLTYTSKRYLLAVDFQTIAHLAGYRTSTIYKNNNCYVVGVITKRKPYIYVQEITTENDNIKDVWCVNTNNGTIISRDNNSIFISGNCEAMWLMLQQDHPDDYIIGAGEGHTVEEFLEEAFNCVHLDFKDFVEIDPNLYRPCEVPYLRCDAGKAERILGWKPKTTFKQLVKLMVESDIREQKIQTKEMSVTSFTGGRLVGSLDNAKGTVTLGKDQYQFSLYDANDLDSKSGMKLTLTDSQGNRIILDQDNIPESFVKAVEDGKPPKSESVRYSSIFNSRLCSVEE
jgi:hypothetical protein